MTVGHQYLLERFGVRPKIAWQIDPFGHGGLSPQLYAEMGFDAVIINRVHHKIKSMMKNSASLEFIWRNGNTSIFTHTLHTHYAAVFGFDFEDRVPTIEDHNINERANTFVDQIKIRAKSYLSNLIMVPFGDDFKFQQASLQFNNMDKLIDYINRNTHYDVQIKYATVSDYIYTLHQRFAHVKFPVVKHDFFPYADNEDSYWTGHFTSLPNLKKRIREAESQLRASETALAFARLLETKQTINWGLFSSIIQKFRENVGTVQHHDSITGTCRTHVAADYMKKVETGEIKKLEEKMISIILEGKGESVLEDINQITLEAQKKYSVLIHNTESNNRLRTLYVKSLTSSVKIKGPKGTIDYQVIPTLEDGHYDIYFQVKTPGFSIQKIEITTEQDFSQTDSIQNNVIFIGRGQTQPKTSNIAIEKIESVDEISISNSNYKIIFDRNSGYIKEVIEKETSKNHIFPHQFLEYQTQRSGSYIFRPNGAPVPFSNTLYSIFISNGPLLNQAIITTDRMILNIRLFSHQDIAEYIEIVHFIKPIPGNTELVTRFGINNGGQSGDLYSFDGLKFLKREIHQNAPIAGRFYPSVAGALYKFSESQVTVFTQQSMAFTAYPNEIEFMIHRRLNSDDGRGMSQPNADASEFRFKILLNYKTFKPDEPKGINMITIHQKSHSVNNPVTAYVTKNLNFRSQIFSPLNDIDPRLQIINFQILNYATDDILLRIQNLSPTKTITFKIQDLFDPTFKLTSIREKSLNLIFDIPHGKTIHTFRTHFKQGETNIFDFTSKLDKGGVDNSQNTEEEGVFISSAALEEKNTGGRRIQSIPSEKSKFTLLPNQIGTYVISIELVGKESGIIVEDLDIKPREKPLEKPNIEIVKETETQVKPIPKPEVIPENQPEPEKPIPETKPEIKPKTHEEEEEDEVTKAAKKEHNRVVVQPPVTTNEIPHSEHYGNLFFVFGLTVVGVCLLCYYLSRRKVAEKERDPKRNV